MKENYLLKLQVPVLSFHLFVVVVVKTLFNINSLHFRLLINTGNNLIKTSYFFKRTYSLRPYPEELVPVPVPVIDFNLVKVYVQY